ncbi:hypothetical protein CGRA01v4_08414 [Colletotrichum graminicola]|uniref:PAC domain-containing protein n=1 Tax=Colletotrichum graminicola (strain M1.001 / M2 / FGSC 10212) TaxID=645133 RepID=E3QYT4_COLGM|nr:uncharacterized protein GLRG_11166 [Colletotrichum graminicola M1.001]EFQ36022.1 hypothetical protein GLRG_11166 [Colletotrichum graminicola M1.001]WDK17131.1 hypothetical protein CGRA01v4_08414 [Colletotrichum graminicola]
MASSISWGSPVTPPYDHYSQNSVGLFEPSSKQSPSSASLPVPAMMLSPPPTPRGSRPKKLSMKLRSNSGLSLHTNEDAFRQYTDYNPDGSPRSPTFGSNMWTSLNGVSTSLRRNFGPTVVEPQPEVWPVPDFLGRELFQMVLNNATTSQRLFQFAQRSGYGPDVEYLLRIQEYSKALAQLGKQVGMVPTPRSLPPTVSKSLNADMKQLTGTVLPGLEMLFTESTRCVETRVARTVYPAFVKHQIVNCTSASLNGAHGCSAYPGLAEAFCIVDVLTPDQTITAASDAFVSVTGYPRPEALSRNCRFLQGTLTDKSTVKRVRDSMLRQEESLELILNYTRDGTPYWNLLFTCPLLDSAGKIRYYLGGQIDVSNGVGEPKDLIRILNSGPASDEAKVETSGRESRVSRRMSRGSSQERRHERRRSLRNQDSLQQNKGRKSLFQPFRKHAAHSSESQENPSPSPGVGLGVDPESLPRGSSSEEQLSVSAHVDSVYPAYSRLIIVQNTDCLPGFPPRSSSLPADPARRKVAPLSVAFCSAAALDALGIRHLADSIAHRDIFKVLSEEADSPSITKSFKSTVRDRIVRDGKSATLDITLGGGYLGRKGSLMGFGSGRSSKDDSDTCSKRQGRPSSRSGFTGLVGETGKTDKFTSHWTPLKNVEEKVEWIIVIITPVV